MIICCALASPQFEVWPRGVILLLGLDVFFAASFFLCFLPSLWLAIVVGSMNLSQISQCDELGEAGGVDLFSAHTARTGFPGPAVAICRLAASVMLCSRLPYSCAPVARHPAAADVFVPDLAV